MPRQLEVKITHSVFIRSLFFFTDCKLSNLILPEKLDDMKTQWQHWQVRKIRQHQNRIDRNMKAHTGKHPKRCLQDGMIHRILHTCYMLLFSTVIYHHMGRSSVTFQLKLGLPELYFIIKFQF